MNNELSPIDIGNLPDLVHLVEEVQRTHLPRVLCRDGQDVAVLAPLVPATLRKTAEQPRARRQPSAADREAFRAAAGSWSDMDTDNLVEDIYESRRISTRPPVKL